MIYIWKYALDVSRGDQFTIPMPKGARVLSAGVQGQGFVLWAVVDTTAPLADHTFAIYGTGNPVPQDIAPVTFVNTVFMGPLVFHVFDLGEQL